MIPIYRNRDTLVELLDRLDAALADEPREYVFVVDGSPDDSLEVLRAEQDRRPHLVVIELARNFGQHAALCAGFEAARGKSVAILDGDLQQRPEDLPRFIAAWREGSDFVSGWRTTRDDPLQRRLGSAVLNRFVRVVTGVELHDWGCPVAVIDRSVIERVATCGEQRRFLKPLVAKLSRRPTELKIEGLARRALFVLWAEPMTLGRLRQTLGVEPGELEPVLTELELRGEISREETGGGAPRFALKRGSFRLYGDHWVRRIDALNNQLDHLANTVFSRFFEDPETPEGFVRTVALSVRREDLGAIEKLYREVIFPELVRLEQESHEDPEAELMELSVSWAPKDLIEKKLQGDAP